VVERFGGSLVGRKISGVIVAPLNRLSRQRDKRENCSCQYESQLKISGVLM
jgi:hypothetical protein